MAEFRTVNYNVLFTRADLDINVLHDRNPLFTRLADGGIRNGYTIKVLNKARDQRTLMLTVEGLAGATLSVVGSDDAIGSNAAYVTVKPDRLQSHRVLVTAPATSLKGRDSTDIVLVLTEINTHARATYSSIFRGPGK